MAGSRYPSALAARPGVPFYALGGLTLVGGAAHYAAAGPTAAALAEALVTLPVFATYVYSGYHIRDESLSARTVCYLLLATATFGLFGASVVGLFLGIQLATGSPAAGGAYLVFLVGATTAAIGPPVGHYYLRAEHRREELARRTGQVSTLNQRLSVINRVLRHNIRNELTVLSGTLTELEADAPDRLVANMRGSLDRLYHLSKHSETLRKVWEVDDTQPIDVAPVLADLADRVRADHPDAAVRTSLPDRALAEAHPKAERALDELVTNAVVHNDTDGLRVSLRATVHDQPAELVRIEIADTGSGIPEDEAALLGRDEETDLEHGQGLGLWLAYWVVEKSGGNLSIDSAPDQGTRIVIELPAAAGAEDGTAGPGIEIETPDAARGPVAGSVF